MQKSAPAFSYERIMQAACVGNAWSRLTFFTIWDFEDYVEYCDILYMFYGEKLYNMCLQDEYTSDRIG